MTAIDHRLIVLAGPSCVGKSPLVAALGRCHPDLADALAPVVLYNSRPPRPGEADGVDYHFRNRAEIEKLSERDEVEVMEVRGDLQALDVEELRGQLARGDVLFEGNPMIGEWLLTDHKLEDIERFGIFVSPLSAAELQFLRDQESVELPALVTDVMRRKLLRRMHRQKGICSGPDLEEVERRCTSAYNELRRARRFARIIVNHDGEDSDNWTAFGFSLGDARRSLDALIALLAGEEEAAGVETWPDDLLPPLA